MPLDDDTPVAPYGTMFWFRPAALKKLFAHEWKWEDFNAEPNHIDGGLAHGLERTICYVAADAKFISMQIMNPSQASFNYCMAEYKLQDILALAPAGSIVNVDNSMRAWKDAGYPAAGLTIKQSLRGLLGSIKRSMMSRTPKIYKMLRRFKGNQ
ncbi:rhamnan synthesis F family protein [Pseudochrobactrum sp. AO18b]|uniref:rhamnan synthesis F family protein n=1 Tax=Pseudochrobactrum sp. AO18b TaxID=1201036 RepID=UPI001FDA0CFA|nr:rhamnan synthesis F family protein [Pseudochrobactrum sp. AO18b]